MENPEEVLQALDEFQKMKPTEIPRELEDYLSWVAKTGDPVYQWSLIKVLFREKLTRVMTDFYESCPNLELAPSPNVEHFNYNTMKCNLLERLESFANAPFTVQRICELLTAPRKEYNRIDKFMRAIEKNILVVSTREPGPPGRRNENGEGMVNGSVEEEGLLSQTAQDVEMVDSWVKDCSSVTSIGINSAVDGETLVATQVITSGPMSAKSLGRDDSPERSADTAAVKPTTSQQVSPLVCGLIPANSELAASVTQQQQDQLANSGSSVQSLSLLVHESTTATGIIGDVPEAIINEDTSSQPSLDMESHDELGEPSNKKLLQTSFRSKDFDGVKGAKFFDANSSESASVGDNLLKIDETSSDDKDDRPDEEYNLIEKDVGVPLVENLLQSDLQNSTMAKDKPRDESLRDYPAIVIPDVTLNGESSIAIDDEESNKLDGPELCCTPDDIKVATTTTTTTQDDASIDKTPCEDLLLDVRQQLPDTSCQQSQVIITKKPIVEEPPSSTEDATTADVEPQLDDFTIEEASDDSIQVTTNSIVPDPIAIVEEPKEPEDIITAQDESSSCADITVEEITDVRAEESLVAAETADKQSIVTCHVSEAKTTTSMDCSMDIDSEGQSLNSFGQDEGMEQDNATTATMTTTTTNSTTTS